MYNVASPKADEFICHEEITATLEYADEASRNPQIVDAILEKAREGNGLNHREASVLLACDDVEVESRIFEIARDIKQTHYGNRIVLFAPLYLSNHCVNGCVYCPYHAGNRRIPRRKLTQEEIAREVAALQDMGHKRIAVEMGEHPVENPIDYLVESLGTIYAVARGNGSIRRANVNIAATTVEDYRRLKNAEIGTYVLFQETYHRKSYESLHPSGPKHDYAWHTEAHDRAMQGGIDDVGLGVLFGLEGFRYEFAGLLMHAEHLEAVFGAGPHTMSVPRIRPADGIDPASFPDALPDATLKRIVACLRIAVPYTGIIVSTREGRACRELLIEAGATQISAASRTSVGGYAAIDASTPLADDSSQFELADHRTLDDVVRWLFDLGHIPSFCTACYRAGRQGEAFMKLCKDEKMASFCHLNALMTLEEYLIDYASEGTRAAGRALIARELSAMLSQPSPATEALVANMERIRQGERDLRF